MPSSPYADFVLHTLVNVLVPAGSAYGGLQLLKSAFDVHIGAPLAWLIISAACPLTITAKVLLESASNRRQAAARGANVIPRLQGYLPGNFDVMLNMVDEFEHGYPGACACIRDRLANFLTVIRRCAGQGFFEMIGRMGSIIDFRVLWEDNIFTVEPEHIKVGVAYAPPMDVADIGLANPRNGFYELRERYARYEHPTALMAHSW